MPTMLITISIGMITRSIRKKIMKFNKLSMIKRLQESKMKQNLLILITENKNNIPAVIRRQPKALLLFHDPEIYRTILNLAENQACHKVPQKV